MLALRTMLNFRWILTALRIDGRKCISHCSELRLTSNLRSRVRNSTNYIYSSLELSNSEVKNDENALHSAAATVSKILFFYSCFVI